MPHPNHPPLPPGRSLSPGGSSFAIPRWPSSRFAFLPLSEEATISTRGQKLPNIIRHQSSSSIRDMRLPSVGGQRRPPPRVSGESLALSRTRTRDPADDGILAPPSDFPIAKGAKRIVWEFAGEERKNSAAVPDVLLTQQMRSQRLIGNSNPRYQWYGKRLDSKDSSVANECLQGSAIGTPKQS